MTQEEILTALYEKMAAEQDKYRDWLKSQPAAEVLNHTYEYTVREDIVMCMEELELTEVRQRRFWLRPRRWPMFTRTLRSWKPATWM